MKLHKIFTEARLEVKAAATQGCLRTAAFAIYCIETLHDAAELIDVMRRVEARRRALQSQALTRQAWERYLGEAATDREEYRYRVFSLIERFSPAIAEGAWQVFCTDTAALYCPLEARTDVRTQN